MEPRRREGSPVAAVMQDARQQVEVTIKDSDAGAESAAAELGTLFREALQLHQAGRLADAVQLYQQALRLHPGAMGLEALGHDAFGLDALGHDAMRRGAICCNLGHALLGLYKRSEALVVCRQAVMLLPESVEALANLGNVLLELGRIEEARAAYEAALGKNPEWLPAIHNLGTVLMEEGRFNAALEVSERVLTLDPHFADARLNRGILRLLHGEFAEGWEDYEARLQVQRTMTPRLSGLTPQWRGEPLAGDSILLYAEQGLGDAIQFLRYVPPVAEAGGEVTLVLPARLVRMAEGMQVRVIAEGELLPECRWQCPLMSLPLALAARGGGWAIPAWRPYLTVPEEERARARSLEWPDRNLVAMRVGLVWAGTPDHTRDWARSLSLDLLAPLLTLPEVQFYSLQTGQPARQAERWQGRIVDLVPLEQDMTDAAAKILELDLVIAVDTSVAHLAGALGKPVWLLLPAVPDWRWQLRREDSPWYPAMRLFRQEKRRAWEPVIARVREELLALVEKSRNARLQNARPDAGDEKAHGGGAHPWLKRENFAVAIPGCEEPPLLPPAVASSFPRPCKICQGPSPLFGVVDFHKSCMEGQGKRLSLSGVPVYYRRCEQCGFLDTEFFDRWSEAAFAQHLYNADYLEVDPDARELRPAGNARLVAESFAGARDSISILDYGGGSGRLAELLRERGFTAETYDPFFQHCQKPRQRFDLITSFEVMEHAPDPPGILASIASLLKTRERDGEDGLLLFSTLLQPEDMQQIGVNWWYAAPRNGHCSLYTANALVRLFASVGMQVASSSPALHLAYRRVPGFARHLRIGTVQDANAAV